MYVSYKKLWKILIDRDMKKKDLYELAGVSPASITKMGKGGHVTTEILKYLLPSATFQRFCDSLENEINELCTNTKQFQKNKILSCMGFPENWLDIKNN